MAIPAANRQTGKRNDSNMVKSLIQVDLPASPEFARSPGASSGTSAGVRSRGYQDAPYAPYHHPAAGMPSISPGAATIPSSPERSVPASSPGATSGYELSEGSWQARSHKDYEAPRMSVYGNQHAEAEGRDRMYNSRNSPLPGNDCGHKVGPLDRRPLDSDQVLAPSSKTSCLAQLGKSSHDGYAAEENHRRGKSDMYSAHLTNAYRPKVTNVLEEKPEASWVKRKTAVVSPQKGAWTKVSPPKQEKVPQYQDTLRTLHRTSLDPQPNAAVKRGEHRKAPLASRFAATAPATADAVETPGTEG